MLTLLEFDRVQWLNKSPILSIESELNPKLSILADSSFNCRHLVDYSGSWLVPARTQPCERRNGLIVPEQI